MFTESDKEIIRNLDFFKKVSTNEWADHQKLNQVKVWGEYPAIFPQCSVVIRTFKRPKLLRRAIDSVLNQEDYNDYLIIVADNEGEDLSIKTDTQRVIEEINDNRIIYYRYETTYNGSRFNAAANLVKTEYMVFLNDDDVFHKRFLRVMMGVMTQHKDIDALMCSQKYLYEDMNETITNIKPSDSGLCRKVTFPETIMSLRNNTTGVIYRTSAYREIGGVIEENLGCGDVILASRFSLYYNQYWLDMVLHGVYVNNGKNQLSMSNPEAYYHSFYTAYYWRKDGLNKYFGRDFFFAEGIVQRRIRMNIEGLKEGMWNSDVSEKLVFESFGAKSWGEKGVITKKMYNLYGRLWDRHVKHLINSSTKRGFVVYQ